MIRMTDNWDELGVRIGDFIYPHQYLSAPLTYSVEMWAVFKTHSQHFCLPMVAVLRKFNEGDLYLLEQLQNVYFPIS